MTKNRFPPGWDEERVTRALDHYEHQTDEEAVAEDEDRYDSASHTVVEVPSDLLPDIRDVITQRKADNLTRRELEVLAYISQGLSSREIAERLSISTNTVRVHTSRILRKLHVAEQVRAVIRSREDQEARDSVG